LLNSLCANANQGECKPDFPKLQKVENFCTDGDEEGGKPGADGLFGDQDDEQVSEVKKLVTQIRSQCDQVFTQSREKTEKLRKLREQIRLLEVANQDISEMERQAELQMGAREWDKFKNEELFGGKEEDGDGNPNGSNGNIGSGAGYGGLTGDRGSMCNSPNRVSMSPGGSPSPGAGSPSRSPDASGNESNVSQKSSGGSNSASGKKKKTVTLGGEETSSPTTTRSPNNRNKTRGGGGRGAGLSSSPSRSASPLKSPTRSISPTRSKIGSATFDPNSSATNFMRNKNNSIKTAASIGLNIQVPHTLSSSSPGKDPSSHFGSMGGWGGSIGGWGKTYAAALGSVGGVSGTSGSNLAGAAHGLNLGGNQAEAHDASHGGEGSTATGQPGSPSGGNNNNLNDNAPGSSSPDADGHNQPSTQSSSPSKSQQQQPTSIINPTASPEENILSLRTEIGNCKVNQRVYKHMQDRLDAELLSIRQKIASVEEQLKGKKGECKGRRFNTKAEYSS